MSNLEGRDGLGGKVGREQLRGQGVKSLSCPKTKRAVEK